VRSFRGVKRFKALSIRHEPFSRDSEVRLYGGPLSSGNVFEEQCVEKSKQRTSFQLYVLKSKDRTRERFEAG